LNNVGKCDSGVTLNATLVDNFIPHSPILYGSTGRIFGPASKFDRPQAVKVVRIYPPWLLSRTAPQEVAADEATKFGHRKSATAMARHPAEK
jgi:hypothetical protein